MEVSTSTSQMELSPIVAICEDMEPLHTKNSLQCRYEPRIISRSRQPWIPLFPGLEILLSRD
jgi:hypothetical protein